MGRPHKFFSSRHLRSPAPSLSQCPLTVAEQAARRPLGLSVMG